ncbi:golgin subfamily A member 1 isoform X1 [Maniola jurtina]|uniref:golgin subfamily A member 1 isoform X1 n=1 Tax=Maniola jurtina TaxID=191418 RepID=UPI001E687484|nr:golgin subfamily A member 1 isoform X1 [Maniola jurtina]XP_045765887.1 golgin subfamily A member 1 isoform X1 [Maniola jurtina]XP_045765898.1 golgin subfamily A member 1 isoform X1 [Maniola jurtina]
MFASLKSKIKEETGSDISKLTSSWRSGAFLGRITLRDDSSTTTSPSSSGGRGDTTSDSISPQLHTYLSERTAGEVDQAALQQQYVDQLETKLKDRDLYWEQKIEELKLSLASVQGEEALVAQAVARTAQAEATQAITAREAAEKQLNELRARLAAAENAQDKLDALTEEVEQSRREWARERIELTAALGAADARARDLADQLELLKAALPPENPHHHMQDDDKREVTRTGCDAFDRVCRERAVLSRQLQEAKMALADVKTSWSGQIATLETQVARVSRQAGEEGTERRRVEAEKRELQEKLASMAAELDKTKQNLANSEAKVARLNAEVQAQARDLKALRAADERSAEMTADFEKRIEDLTEENRALAEALENERTLVKILREKVEKSHRLYDEQKAEVNQLNSMMTDMQHDYIDIQRKFDKEKREKDEALLRNAHMSQNVEMSQCNVRYLETEVVDLKAKITELEAVIAQHKENQAECMIIKENEAARTKEMEQLQRRIESFAETEAALRKSMQDLETEICDKNKKIKTLDNRISDMKKTLQRELQSSKSDLSSAEEQDISRRYLKHVVLRFLTARELEARQLTRALAVLLRLSSHEEALLRAALPGRSGLSAWFPSLNT